jgi:hypothetical protein
MSSNVDLRTVIIGKQYAKSKHGPYEWKSKSGRALWRTAKMSGPLERIAQSEQIWFVIR